MRAKQVDVGYFNQTLIMIQFSLCSTSHVPRKPLPFDRKSISIVPLMGMRGDLLCSLNKNHSKPEQ